MVCYSDVISSCVSSSIKRLSIFSMFVNFYVKSISCGQWNILIFWNVVDRILANKFKWSIRVIWLEYSYDTFWEGNAELILFWVQKLYFISCFDVIFWVSSSVNCDLMILSYWDVINFRDKLNLLLWGFVKRDGLAQCVHVIISESFLAKWWCTSNIFLISHIRHRISHIRLIRRYCIHITGN